MTPDSAHAVRLSTRGQLELMTQLQRAATKREHAQQALQQSHSAQCEQVEIAHQARIAELECQFDRSIAELQRQFEQAKGAILDTHQRERDRLNSSFDEVKQQIEKQHAKAVRKAKKQRERARFEIMSVFDAAKGQPRIEFEETTTRLKQFGQNLQGLIDQGRQLAIKRRCRELAATLEISSPQLVASDSPHAETGSTTESQLPLAELLERLQQDQQAAESTLTAIARNKSSQLAETGNAIVLAIGCGAIMMPLTGLLAGWTRWWWVPFGLGLTVITSLTILMLVRRLAMRQLQPEIDQLRRHVRAGWNDVQAAHHAAKVRSRQHAEAIVATRDRDLGQSAGFRDEQLNQADQWRSGEMMRAVDTYPPKVEDLLVRQQQLLSRIEQDYQPRILATQQQRQVAIENQVQRYDEKIAQLDAERESVFDQIRRDWLNACATFESGITEMQRRCDAIFPDWDSSFYDEPPVITHSSEAVPFGEVTLSLTNVKHGVTSDSALAPAQNSFLLVALMALRENPGLIITAPPAARAAVLDTLRTVAVRLLTGMPPGRTRFTLFDPVGLGDSFAEWAHLADVDAALIHQQIWSEGRAFEARLAETTQHVERVIQMHLRNEFATVWEYNDAAGEIAEPFEVLLIANFPAGFSEAASRRLANLCATGPRCGVIPLIWIDPSHRLPPEIDIKDIHRDFVHLRWDGSRLRWEYGPMRLLPMKLDAAPTPQRLTQIIRAAGELAARARRVEVPFEIIAPADEEIWGDDNARGLTIPVGRHGAGGIQTVELGKGTAQHILIAGKTGSGKSTFLHALVTSSALRYSPDQLHLYLVDFKKGVEFKCYADGQLPHAQVVAIESEREFGLSVLQRLDEELRDRGAMFREAGVQDLPAYRSANTEDPLPRILLIVDEFQEFFVEDDSISQEAALLLDRLVRQGRAFGVHVVLGSQTLSGAYSLARSTLGQIAVRVALACSDADAHLILSEENLAARQLMRPGEAIYNDRNGLRAGNQHFQVVWLPDDERMIQVNRIVEAAEAKQTTVVPPIVFEGNSLAELQMLPLFSGDEVDSPDVDAVPYIRLGSPVSIGPATRVDFPRQIGANFLMVTSDAIVRQGTVTAAAVELAASQRSAGQDPPIYVVNGSSSDDAMNQLLARLQCSLTPQLKVFSATQLAGVLVELTNWLDNSSGGVSDHTGRYLLLIGLGGLRGLEKVDEFRFSQSVDSSTGAQLERILRDGPTHGLHTLLWAESPAVLSRAFSRTAMAQFENRAATRLPANDSSDLLETAAASRLGMNRALLVRSADGITEKFRPFGPPDSAWLDDVCDAVAARYNDATRVLQSAHS